MIELLNDLFEIGLIFFGVAFLLFSLFKGELLGEERPTTAHKEEENQ